MSKADAKSMSFAAEELIQLIEPVLRRIVREELAAYAEKELGVDKSESAPAVNGGIADARAPKPVVEDALSPLDSLAIKWTDKRLMIDALDRLMKQLGIMPEPIGAVALRERIEREANLVPNEISRGIIEMREEKLRDRGLF